MKVALFGANGLVGSAIGEALRRAGDDVAGVSAPRLRHPPSGLDGRAVAAAVAAVEHHDERVLQLAAMLDGCDAVVVAAGAADPTSKATAELFGANGLLPVVALAAASRAGMRRLVHVSSAAVQGNRPTLDESAAVSPLSPYATSKALGELALQAWSTPNGPEVVVYRPTSVLAPGRPVSLQLLRLLSGPVVPVVAGGDAPQPLALLENVAAATVTLCRAAAVAPINLHPWEGMSVARLLDLADRHPIRLPVPPRVIDAVVALARRGPSGLLGVARRLELYAHGQQIAARGLVDAGYVPVAGDERYRELLRSPGACR